MVVALAVVLGIDIWVMASVFGAVLWSRRHIVIKTGVFECKARRIAGDFDGIRDRWPRRPRYAEWVHDVLIVHRGITLVRSVALPVATCTEIAGTARLDVKSFGSAPQIVELHLDDGAIIELAGPTEAPLLGPFAARAGSTTTIATALDPANVPHD